MKSNEIKCISTVINPIPHEKFKDWSKLKAVADDKINLT